MFWAYAFFGFLCVAGASWGVWSGRYFMSAYDLSGVAKILPSDMSYIIFSAALPIILLAMVAAVVLLAISNHANRSAMVAILKANRRSLESLQIISKSLIEVRKLGFTNQFFENLPLVIDDMSISIAGIISKTGMASEVVVFDAMNKTGNNRLYAVCKIVLDLHESTPHFDENLRRRVRRDESAMGAIGTFAYRYEKFLSAIKSYDVDGFARGMMEEGPVGKVYNVFRRAINPDGAEPTIYE